MERLGHLINGSVSSREWQPFRFIRNGIPVSHLFFADDIILYAKAKQGQTEVIQNVLTTFAMFSGHQVNKRKTEIYFSPNTASWLQDEVSRFLGYQRVESLGKYLGVSFLHAHAKCSDFSFILDKIKDKLNGWASHTLSLAGRVTLAKSALAAIPVYFMQTCILPKKVCNDIEKIMRQFIWGSSEASPKFSLVNWESICQPVKNGSLGIRRLFDFNMAFILKIGFSLVSAIDSFWVRILRQKYKLLEVCPRSVYRQNSTPIMKGSVRGMG
ncbi:hypothetical protein HRI_000797100 [Hibiscus trionum]|uniref:Reverse transcriptase domain-containing protein n=1 Tax=Hibiscus trionum TaxID=183268 RepID=A0A9W7H5X6_HIBTR|nr:hypothetical protein HRI_000797100 [Hibiscus trionum]